MEYLLYSNGCPKCIVLEKKLNNKKIEFNKTGNMKELMDLGFRTIPVLKIDDKFYSFADAIRFLNGMVE